MDKGAPAKLWDNVAWHRPVMDKARAFTVQEPWYGMLAGGHVPEIFEATQQVMRTHTHTHMHLPCVAIVVVVVWLLLTFSTSFRTFLGFVNGSLCSLGAQLGARSRRSAQLVLLCQCARRNLKILWRLFYFPFFDGACSKQRG